MADQVGSAEHVTGIDIASPDYGAPLTLDQAWSHLLAGPLGDRLTVHFNTNLSDDLGPIADQHFDRVVLVHSLWYFASANANALALLFKNMAAVCDHVDVAEWSMLPTALDQIGHLQAAMIHRLAVCHCSK